MDQSTQDAARAGASAKLDSIAAIRAQQNLSLALAAGLGAAVAGAVLWAMVTVATKMELGIVAVAIGYAVGQAVKNVGKGIDPVFGYVGAGCALLGCLLGNILSAVAFYAQATGLSLWQAFGSLDAALIQRLAAAYFSAMDLLFYGIAIYEGYRFSFKYKAR